MTEEQQEKVKFLTPVCPHCGDGATSDPTKGARLATVDIQMGAYLCVLVMCGNPDCRTIHSVQVLHTVMPMGGSPQAEQVGGGGPKLVVS